MNLSSIKSILPTLDTLVFELENGNLVPEHFHVTEIGQINKHFIDCGGVVRTEQKISFQLWYSDDLNHRLNPQRLLDIIRLSEEKLNIQDAEIEVEYQLETIGKFHLDFNGKHFVLKNAQTACLAEDQCKIPVTKNKIQLSTLGTTTSCCSPDSGCC